MQQIHCWFIYTSCPVSALNVKCVQKSKNSEKVIYARFMILHNIIRANTCLPIPVYENSIILRNTLLKLTHFYKMAIPSFWYNCDYINWDSAGIIVSCWDCFWHQFCQIVKGLYINYVITKGGVLITLW